MPFAYYGKIESEKMGLAGYHAGNRSPQRAPQLNSLTGLNGAGRGRREREGEKLRDLCVLSEVYRNPPNCKRLQGAADARRRVRRRTPCTSSARQQSRCGAEWNNILFQNRAICCLWYWEPRYYYPAKGSCCSILICVLISEIWGWGPLP
jgi:hypothetical protein